MSIGISGSKQYVDLGDKRMQKYGKIDMMMRPNILSISVFL